MITVGIISLGCQKNQSDSEVLIGHILKSGMTLTADMKDADVILINTCSFILDARNESYQAIKDAIKESKRKGRKKKLSIIVAGCLPQRYRKTISETLTEVDAFIGIDELESISELILKIHNKKNNSKENPLINISASPKYVPDYTTPRARLTPQHLAYIKIAEGCNHCCAFCAIPKIRGKHRSRSIESIVKEVQEAVKAGCKEINLISQDTTYYGMDTWENTKVGRRTPVSEKEKTSLLSLLKAIDKIKGDFWVRILYTHPAHWSDELIHFFAKSKHTVPYIDIPLQHISDSMLENMERETDGNYIRTLIEKIKANIPNVTLRSTFIVGFPGETETDFNELLDFVKKYEFDRVGVFQYSKEENTKGEKMPHQCQTRVKQRRWDTIMKTLQKISLTKNKQKIGKTIRVLVEEPGIARSAAEAADVDGLIFVPKTLPVGEFATVTIKGYKAYDLIAQ